MTIGIDCRLWSESGVGRYIRNLVLELYKLDKKNNYVLFAKSSEISDIKDLVRSEKWKVVPANIHWHTVKEQLLFPAIIRAEDIDLMHFPYFSVPIFYNKPYVITIHDLILHHFPTGKASTLPPFLYWVKHYGYKTILQIAADKSRSILAPSEATRQEIIKLLGVEEVKVHVTTEGVDSGISTPIRSESNSKDSGRASLARMTREEYFLYVGNAYPHKNLERLIEAFLSLDKKFQLILVGKEDYFYKRLMKKYQPETEDGRLIFFGYATDKELSILYQNAVATVIPSLMEGFGLPVLEAMANGSVVACSNIPSHKEICQDGALYFEPTNVHDITVVLKHIINANTSELSILRKKAKDRIGLYTFENMAKQTLDIYENSIVRP